MDPVQTVTVLMRGAAKQNFISGWLVGWVMPTLWHKDHCVVVTIYRAASLIKCVVSNYSYLNYLYSTGGLISSV